MPQNLDHFLDRARGISDRAAGLAEFGAVAEPIKKL